MLKYVFREAFSRLRKGILIIFKDNKGFNKKIVSYEKICTFGINPDALL